MPSPRAQSTMRIMTIVQSIVCNFSFLLISLNKCCSFSRFQICRSLIVLARLCEILPYHSKRVRVVFAYDKTLSFDLCLNPVPPIRSLPAVIKTDNPSSIRTKLHPDPAAQPTQKSIKYEV